jgi:hypothetical protein
MQKLSVQPNTCKKPFGRLEGDGRLTLRWLIEKWVSRVRIQ